MHRLTSGERHGRPRSQAKVAIVQATIEFENLAGTLEPTSLWLPREFFSI